MITLHDCIARDANDPLRDLRDAFNIPANTIYLDGNSLGVMPRSAPARVADVVTREWGTDLIQSWNKNGWFQMPGQVSSTNRHSCATAEYQCELICTFASA